MKGTDLAKARDEWFTTCEGEGCLNSNILERTEFTQYLKNRLARAFIAGANWRDQTEEKPG